MVKNATGKEQNKLIHKEMMLFSCVWVVQLYNCCGAVGVPFLH